MGRFGEVLRLRSSAWGRPLKASSRRTGSKLAWLVGRFAGWARLTIIGTNIFSNTADYGYGGGIFGGDEYASTLTLTNTHIYSNTVHAHGGGIFSANITADDQTAIYNNDREQCYAVKDPACGRLPVPLA